MNVFSTTARSNEATSEVVVVTHYAESSLGEAAGMLDVATGGLLTRLVEAKEITGKRNEVVVSLAPAGIAAKAIAVVGLGKREEIEPGVLSKAFGAAAKAISGKQRGKVTCYGDAAWSDSLQSAAIAGMLTGCVGQDLYRAEKKRFPFQELGWSGASEAAIKEGSILGSAINLTRRLVNEPPSEMYPETFAAEAEHVASQTGLTIEVWDEDRLESENCGSLLAVAKGSDRPARLVILTYQGGKPNVPPLALVGKGVTFDSGGLSIKPTDGMKTMKCDMAGAATVLGAMQAIAQLKLPVNVIGLCGLVENMINGKSYKLGDVLKARSGKTIEVLNTDAEGRLVLADVLSVALDRNPSHIIDLATLTGACVVALGTDVAGAMTNDEAWQAQVLAAAKTVGEYVWPLPMYPEFNEQIKSDVADIKNVGDGRWGGAITAAKFLEEFVESTPWVHLDIAGPAFLDSPKPWSDAGGSGALVRTLVQVAKNFGN